MAKGDDVEKLSWIFNYWKIFGEECPQKGGALFRCSVSEYCNLVAGPMVECGG